MWQLTVILIGVVSLSVCLQSVCNHHISGDNFDLRKATVETLKNEQRIDKSLAHCWSLAERDKAGYIFQGWYSVSSPKITRKHLFSILTE